MTLRQRGRATLGVTGRAVTAPPYRFQMLTCFETCVQHFADVQVAAATLEVEATPEATRAAVAWGMRGRG